MKYDTLMRLMALVMSLLGIYFLVGTCFDWPGAGFAQGAALIAWGEATDCRADIAELRKRL